MVRVEIDDQVWDLYRRSWALFGVKTEAELIRMLHVYMEESSTDVLNDAERHLISHEPEALARRELGLMKEGKLEMKTSEGDSEAAFVADETAYKKHRTVLENVQELLDEGELEDSPCREKYFLPFQLESLTLNHVGPFEKFEANFRRNSVNVIVGRCGSGKSTLLRAILYAFGQRHPYLDNRALSGGTIRLKIFPDENLVDLTDIESPESITKGFRCLLADEPFQRVPLHMVPSKLNELHSLGIQSILTTSILPDLKMLPADVHIISLENYPHYR